MHVIGRDSCWICLPFESKWECLKNIIVLNNNPQICNADQKTSVFNLNSFVDRIWKLTAPPAEKNTCIVGFRFNCFHWDESQHAKRLSFQFLQKCPIDYHKNANILTFQMECWKWRLLKRALAESRMVLAVLKNPCLRFANTILVSRLVEMKEKRAEEKQHGQQLAFRVQ